MAFPASSSSVRAVNAVLQSHSWASQADTRKGYDHNWNDAGGYPIQLMQNAGDAFQGVTFHCYSASSRGLI